MDATAKRKEVITDLCDQSGCSDKIRKIHFEQYVYRNWHPHPSKDFISWWRRHPECAEGIFEARAYNCQYYHDQYIESRQIGAA